MVALIRKVEMPPDVSDFGREADNLIGDFETKLLLRKLPARQRMAFKLHIQGYKAKEIGRKMNLTPNTIYYYLKLSRKKLREILK